MEVVVTTGAIRIAKLQSDRHYQQTKTQHLTGLIIQCCLKNSASDCSHMANLKQSQLLYCYKHKIIIRKWLVWYGILEFNIPLDIV